MNRRATKRMSTTSRLRKVDRRSDAAVGCLGTAVWLASELLEEFVFVGEFGGVKFEGVEIDGVKFDGVKFDSAEKKSTLEDSSGGSGSDGAAFGSVSLIEVRLLQRTYERLPGIPQTNRVTPRLKTTGQQCESSKMAHWNSTIVTDPILPRQSINLGLM